VAGAGKQMTNAAPGDYNVLSRFRRQDRNFLPDSFLLSNIQVDWGGL